MNDLSSLSGAVLDAIDEPVLIVRGEKTLAANRAARALLGHDIANRDLRLAIRHPLALATILAGRDAEVEVIGIGAIGRPWHLTVRALVDGAALVRLAERSAMQAAERMRTDFVANASHELRTPLATIIGFAETIAEPGAMDEALRVRFGATIELEARRMLRIVEDLMSLSRISADRFNPPEAMVDFASVVRQSIDQAGVMLEQAGCTIDASIAGDAPAVRGDRGQLLQLADNLIGNALRHGCTAASRTIEVAMRRDGARILFTVRDHGDGIAPDHLPRVTERFYRVDAARSRDSGGTGLGLAIVKHIVERHRGTLEIKSPPGAGTSVTVALPLAADAVTKA